jgi:UDP-N-acetylmuramoyl-tripeptide--D-alanyl-D-alanine ligase
MTPLWLAEDAQEATGGRLIGSDSWLASGVSIDTRSLEPGDLFVALKDQRDGHEFLAQAFAAGASAALVSNPDAAAGAGPMLVVDDVLDGLRRLGVAARDRSGAVRIAVTGSVGKTSTKEAIAVCLAASGVTHAAVKSFNNHWGVPLTLSRMPADSRFGVFEMGMNHRGEIAPLAALVRPHIAIVTWIAPAHIENLGSLEAIAEEKADVYSVEPGGAGLVPLDAPHSDILLARAKERVSRVVTFGRDARCDARLLAFDMFEDRSEAEADILGKRIAYTIGAPGAHWAGNSVAALATAALAGADLEAAAAALVRFEAPAGRSQTSRVMFERGAFTLIDDAYNANPASMEAAFKTLASRKPAAGGRRIAALGDMLELGPEEASYHAGLAAGLTDAADLVFAAGPRMRALWDALPATQRGGYSETAEALAPVLTEALRDGDVVLVKGSNGSRMFRVVEALKRLAVG